MSELEVALVVEPPEGFHEGLLYLADLGPEEQQELLARLHNTSDAEFSSERLCAGVAGDEKEFLALLLVADVLASESARPEEDQWVDGLAAWAAERREVPHGDRRAFQAEKSAFFKRMMREEHGLWRVVKKQRLVEDQPNHFKAASIHSDLRPVFGRDPTRAPFAWIVMHTLRIRTEGRNGPVEHYMGIDSAGLDALAEVVERARKKATTLAANLDRILPK